MTTHACHTLLRDMLSAAIEAALPSTVLSDHLPEKPKGRCIVVGAGKSAAAMASALEEAWPDVDLSGVVVTRYGHAAPCDRIIVREASHPVPDLAGLNAAREILAAAQTAGPDDLVLALISGGGSSLMPLPVRGLSLEDKILVNRALLRSGLSIDEMNRVRRRLSQIKGGGLARAAQPARLVTLAISDVPGDDPVAIASGPTVPDPTCGEDLTGLVNRLGGSLPDAARELLCAAPVSQPSFDVDYRLIATPHLSLQAAAKVALHAGVVPVLLGDALEGEARELGVVMAGIAHAVMRHGTPARAPAVLLSGGETTVTLGEGPAGRGGRNTEFLLSLGLALEEGARVHALAADTDGIDGTEDAAGAFLGPGFIDSCRATKLDPAEALRLHCSYDLFETLGQLIRTGPTLTNVNDFRAVLIT